MKTPTVARPNPRANRRVHQHGASLIVVMLILIVVSVLGVGAAQISMMSERGARNDRDMQVAWQAAESALMDAQSDILELKSSRIQVFGTGSAEPNLTLFPVNGCGTASLAEGKSIGLCDLSPEGTPPKWLTAKFTEDGDAADTTRYGWYTDQTYPSGNGVRSVKAPRYIIEPIRDTQSKRSLTDAKDKKFLYRVTAMGFGPRQDIQAVAQMILRP